MSDIEKSAQTQSNEPAEPSFRYNADLAQGIEEKWQKIWDDEGTFWAANVNGDLKDGKGRNAEGRPSYFAMDMFPYPSGKGLHVGHPLGYLATDVVSRYHRMKGENVLHAMGYDAFGLPAEQYAVQTGQHPRITTEQNIANMRRQLHRMGLSFDNRRSFATIDPGVAKLVEMGVELGHKGNPDLVCGVCGEHGGDPESIHTFNRIGLDYVSCSPYRVPVARLAAAQAAIKQR